MAVADVDYRFTYVDVVTNGRVYTTGVFSQSSLSSEPAGGHQAKWD